MPRTWYGRRLPDTVDTLPRQDALVAAAVTVGINNPPSHVQWGGAGWQLEAWQHYDTCPELHAAASIIGNAFSRAKMIAVDVDPLTLEMGTEPTSDPVANALVARLFGGPTGRAQAQRQMGVHLTVPGDCWVLASDQIPDVDSQTWQIISVSEVTKSGAMIQIQNLDGTMRTLQDTELLFRMFQPHPKRRWDADSPSRALLPVFRELAGLSAQIMASIKSRLATGGVWLLPQSAGLPDSVDEFGNKLPGGATGWMRLLADAMTTAIANPEDASAVVPIVSLIPDDVLDKIKDPIKFVQDIMSEVQPLREAAQRRIAIGMDMPPETLLGLGDVNHWSAWQIDEAFIKGPLASLLALPADAFTSHYLRPGLRIAGKNPGLFAIVFDTNDMITEANEANAKQAYGDGVLSEESYLKALHFDPVRDAASTEERERALILRMVGRGNPQTAQELEGMLRVLYPNFKLDPLEPLPVPGGPTVIDAAPVAPQKAITAPSTTDTQQPPQRPATPPDNTPSAP